MPRETIGYLRLPNPWHLLGDLTGRSSDRAYGSSSWRSQLDQLRAAAPMAARQQGWPVGLGATLALVDSPIEIVLLDAEGQLGSDNRVLLSTSLSTDRVADAARLTAEW
ncbi:MAG: hypothetical protein KDI37_17365, partial [Xanthomonadales bacterium]|nr:hypothetical protein [Xanthomonadales bacterium]